MNQSDGEKLEKILIDLGYSRSCDESSADMIAVVACSIRKSAIDRVYGKARIWKKRRGHGKLKTILSGCVLDHDRKKLAELFDFVVDIKDLWKLKEALSQDKVAAKDKDYLSLLGKKQSDFQAYVPIMTGCNNFCSYCVVPHTRGREKSRPASKVISECKDLIVHGYKEITLLGQNVNSYKSGKYDFPKLIKEIDEIEGDYWLRFLTSHPKDLSDSLIRVMRDGKHIAPYLHLAVQSGDDEILRAMNRKYSVEHFLKIVEKVRKVLSGIMLSTDIIVGFPGEGKRQFENTVKLFRKARFDMAYISEFSPRRGTAAAKLKDDVSKIEKSRRKEIVNELLRKIALQHNEKYIGRKVKVLVEKFHDGRCVGKTDTYKLVIFPGDKELVGKFVEIKIDKVESWRLYGEKQ